MSRSRALLEDQWTCYIPYFHDVMPKNRFLDIFWMLHLPSEFGPLPRRMDKIQPLLSRLLSAFQSHFYPAQNVCVDETMVGFKGRVKFKQYCKDKPTKWGLKVYTLADSNTGYLYNILPYTGCETPRCSAPSSATLT